MVGSGFPRKRKTLKRFEKALKSRSRLLLTIEIITSKEGIHPSAVTLDASGQVVAFQLGGGDTRNPLAYKTVNIHSLSLSTWRRMSRCLDAYVSSGRVNDYYEAVFSDMTVDGAFDARAVSFDDGNWYEIDTLEDLRAAERLFANSRHREAKKMHVAVETRPSTRLG